MAIADYFNIITTISLFWNTVIFISLAWLLVVIVIILIFVLTSRKKKSVDVSALAALASSDQTEDAAPNANPKEVMAILQIERVAASTALSAVKDARKSKRISSGVSDSLTNRYKARIAKIDTDMKRRSGAQEYKSLADSLEQSREKLRDEVMPTKGTPPPPPPPTSSTPGIPATAPPVPGVPRAPATSGPPSSSAPPQVPGIPSAGPPKVPTIGSPPTTKSMSPIPTPPRIPPVSSSAKPTTVVPPSVAPPTVSTPPMPPKLPTSSPVAPPTTSNMAPPPVPTAATSAPSAPTAASATADGDGQSISGLRMEMLRELARLKKFMSEETQ